MFSVQFAREKKNNITGVILALFLGGFGAHRFYFGQIALGIVYLVFALSLIPSIVPFIEAFMMSGRVDRHKRTTGRGIAARIKLLGASA